MDQYGIWYKPNISKKYAYIPEVKASYNKII